MEDHFVNVFYYAIIGDHHEIINLELIIFHTVKALPIFSYYIFSFLPIYAHSPSKSLFPLFFFNQYGIVLKSAFKLQAESAHLKKELSISFQ